MASRAEAPNVVRLDMQLERPADASAVNGAQSGKRRFSRRTLTVSALAVAAAAGGAFWITAPASSQATNDAYVAADSTSVAPKVGGLVAAVLVRDNQAVRAGDPLVRIDPEEYDARVAAARAALADARADVAAARAAIVSHSAELQLDGAQIAETRTSIRAADAQASKAAADQRRADALGAQGFASRSTIDSYRAAAVSAEQDAAHARATLSVSQEGASLTASKRDSLSAAVQKAEARVLAAQAALDLALQDRDHALIRAPIDGVVGNRQSHVGDYVQPGSRLMTLVPVTAAYVTANFKETQVRGMRVGQAAEIDVDALARPLKGHVESFAPGSGSTFSLLPFEPGTGNFTKIVQRVPVRIRIDPGQPGFAQLRPGLSASVTVRLKD
jgi:membrane fusion protein (multidrug efflux system)